MEPFKEAVEAWLQRVRAPILGYTLLAALAINWKALWALVFSDIDVFSRFFYFDLRTDVWTLLFYPAAIGFSSAIASPWIVFVGAWFARKPTALLRRLQQDVRADQEIYRLEMQARIEGAKAEEERARDRRKLDELKRTQEAEELGPDAVEALWQARAADQEQDADGALLHSHIDEFAIKFLGWQPNAVNQAALMSAPRGFEEFMEVVPGATPQRFRTELIDAFARLKKRGLVSDVGVLDWSLTSTGYKEYDRLSKSS